MKRNYAFLLSLLPLSAMGNWFTVTTENLPNTLVVGHKYSDVALKIKNNSKDTIKNLKINGVQSPLGFSLMGSISQCKFLAPGATCTAISSGQYLSNSMGSGKAEWSLNFTDGIEKYTQQVTRKLATTGVIGTITTNIPANVEKEFKYPIAYTFQSLGAEVKNVAVISPTISGLHLTHTCPATLAPNATCTVSGEYIAPARAIGKTVSLPVTLRYNQGETITLTPRTKVDDIAISGTVTKALPANTPEGTPVEFAYTFINDSDGNATGVGLKLPLSIGSLRLTDNCGSVLAPRAMCTVSGTYTPSARHVGQTVSIPVILYYAQGTPVALTTSTTIDDIAVNGKMTKAPPANSPEGVKVDLVYTFTNDSSGKATGVKVSIPPTKGLSLKSNCPATLLPNAACTVSGAYTPPASDAGQTVTIPVTLHYNQGAPTELAPSMKVDDIAISGIYKGGRTNTPEGQTFKLDYIFTNGSSGSATGVKVRTPSVKGLRFIGNNCPPTLAPNAKCTVTTEYTAPSSAVGQTISFPATLHYDQGAPVTLTPYTKVTDVAVNGSVTQPLPVYSTVGSKFKLEYTFTNNSSGTASRITVALPSTNGLTLATHCFTSLAPNSKCTVSGTYTPPASAAGQTISFPVALHYKQGTAVPLTPTTKVVKTTYAFITGSNGAIVKKCVVDPNTGKFDVCTDSGATGFTPSLGIALNPTGTRAFIVIGSQDYVVECSVDPATGNFYNCLNTLASNLNFPKGIALNTAGTRAFIVNYGNNTVTQCSVDPTTGKFSACKNTGATGINFSSDIILNAAGTRAFMTNTRLATITRCNVNSATGQFSSCAQTGKGATAGSNDSYAITLNAAGTRAYVATMKTVNQCSVDPATGNFSACKNTGATNINFPIGVTLNTTGTRAFITNFSDNTITQCSVDSASGNFSNCANTGATGLNHPMKTVLHTKG